MLSDIRSMLMILPLLLIAWHPQAISQERTMLEGRVPITMGVFPRRNAATTTKLFRPLEEYLSERLGRPVVLETSSDFASFWEGVRNRRYDIVHYNQYHYIESSQDYEVMAQNEEFGHRTISGALFVRRDSDIDNVEQLRGRKIVFGGGKAAMMSNIVPRYLLMQAGVMPGDYDDSYSTNPPNSVLSVYYRQADAAGAGDRMLSLPLISSKIDTSSIKILKKSEPLSHLPWAVKRELPADLRDRLKELFLSLNDDDAGNAVLSKARLTGMNRAEDSDYDEHRRIVEFVRGNRDP